VVHVLNNVYFKVLITTTASLTFDSLKVYFSNSTFLFSIES
jgi:hypothetical protein